MRSTETTVTFRTSFTLSSLDGPQPAGTYKVMMDDEELDGPSFPVFRRMATMLRLPALSVASANYQLVPVDPQELQAALDADQRA